LKQSPSNLEIKAFLREAALMAPLSHPNVLSLIGVCTSGASKMMIVQLCENGSLLSYLQKHTGFNELRSGSKIRILKDIATGMEFLSSLLIVHRDLAARNVLVPADFVCKVTERQLFCFCLRSCICLNNLDFRFWHVARAKCVK
jgi:Eph receptor B1